MRWPWVARSRYDELKTQLEARLAATESERRLLMDRLQLLTTGATIYEKPAAAEVPAAENPSIPKPTEEQKRRTEVEDAIAATGSTRMSRIIPWLNNRHARAASGKQHLASESFDRAIEEGRKDARA